MKLIKLMKNRIILLLLSLACFISCTQIEYTEIQQPAYLRVFNNLNYEVRLENRFERPPFLTMLIDPVFDADGVPVSAAIVGDFLDSRDKYAAPFPTHSAGSTSVKNPEYPGKENVLVGPILNGFDLSSWAQIPSGEHRIVFFFRPISETPFFSLESSLRKEIAIDETVNLQAKEVYTLHVLQKDYKTKENGIILRQENFHKIPLSDSLVYFNIYNMSAKGFVDINDNEKPDNTTGFGVLSYGISDQMNVYLSLFPKTANENNRSPYLEKDAIPGYYGNYVTMVERNTESSEVQPYFSYPLFAGSSPENIKTDMLQFIYLLAPGISFQNNPFSISGSSSSFSTKGQFAALSFEGNGTGLARAISAFFPNMIINIHSGVYNPRSFASVNTIEIVNGKAYLMTIQRKYDPPIY